MDVKSLEKSAAGATANPEAAVKFLVDCMYVYQQGDDKALGFLGYVLSKKECEENMQSPSGLVPNNRNMQLIKRVRNADNPNGIVSVMGGTWEKDYKDVKPDSYKLPIVKKDELAGETRIFLKSGGRDNPYPIGMRKNSNGEWKITNGVSTMVMDVRKPKSVAEDF